MIRLACVLVTVFTTGCTPCLRYERQTVHYAAVDDLWLPMPMSYDGGKSYTTILQYYPGHSAYDRVEDVCVERATTRGR